MQRVQKIIFSIVGTVVVVITSIFGANVKKDLNEGKITEQNQIVATSNEVATSSEKEELDNKIETKDNEEEKTVVKDNKKVEEKPIENEECEYQENKYIRVKANFNVNEFKLSNGVEYRKGDYVGWRYYQLNGW